MATVVAQPVTEAGAAVRAMETETAEIQTLRDVYEHPGDSLRKRAGRLNCHHDTVATRIKKLVRQKLVDDGLAGARLSPKGQRELNALDQAKPLSDTPDNVFRFPVPG